MSFINHVIHGILCFLNIHFWNEPYHRNAIVYTADILFWSFGYQTGIRKCKYCNKEQQCYRDGVVGSGGYSSKWRKLKSNANIPTIHRFL